MKTLFKTIIKDFHLSVPYKAVHSRNLTVPLKSGKIVSLIGPRRSGKTFFFYSLINQLLQEIPPERILYVNFEDERIEPRAEHLHLLLEAYYELYPENYDAEIFLFLDEVQSVQGWERFVRRLYDTRKHHIFITGSSAKMLSKEIATSLRGRNLTYTLFPLSFREYCQFHGTNADDLHSTPARARLRAHFERFLIQGGFPETVQLADELIPKTLQSYFDVMLFRDIVERHNVANTVVLKQFIKKLMSTVSSEFSVHKFYNELKSQGIAISKNSIYQFVDFVTDCFMMFVVPRFEPSLAGQQLRSKKVYAIDTGLLNSITFRFSQDTGKLLENTVFLELARQSDGAIFFYKNRYECDFVVQVQENICSAYQVCANMQNPATREREVTALRNTMQKYGLNHGTILTMDDAEEIQVTGARIDVLPAWKWLLTFP